MLRLSIPGVMLAGALAACSSGSAPSSSADGGQDGGTTDAGYTPWAPLLRMDDSNPDLAGTTHTNDYQGVVVTNEPPSSVPSLAGMVTPADELSVRTVAGSTRDLYYTLRSPFRIGFVPNDQVHVVYRELAAGTGSSYGVRLETIFGDFRMLIDDGEYGPAFDHPADRLNFTFALDTQPAGEEPDKCGRKVHYPGLISQGQQTKRLFPGQAAQFSLSSGSVVTFTLLDMYRIEDDTCGTSPDYSIAYIVQPSM